MSSQAIAHYRLVRKLRSSSSGDVYMARDTRLDRIVALKLMAEEFATDAEQAQRFIQEARVASSLSHPNVCVIDEVNETAEGRLFIAMEYIEGEPLTDKIAGQPLPVSEISDIAAQIADALDDAHSKGIIHGNLKPGNIMLTPRGRAKVLDFGLASAARTVEDATGLERTLPLMLYLSPEQILGQPVDHRSDIFSLGVVMYEMATGTSLFEASASVHAIDRINRLDLDALPGYDSRLPLWQIIRKCLRKDPEQRYRSARELLVELNNLQRESERNATNPPHASSGTIQTRSRRGLRVWLPLALVAAAVLGGAALLRATRQSPQDRLDSIAVLPFVNQSDDPNAEYLSDGITESLINSLSRLSNLRVTPWSTAFRYKGESVDPQQAGRRLKVDAVLVGRVMRWDDQLIIRTNLVKVADSSQLWGEQFNEGSSDVFEVQEQIARRISEKLRTKLSGRDDELLAKRPTGNTEAYRLYLRGRFFWNKRTDDGYRRAIEYFEQAIAIDPGYALAYAGLADCYVLGGGDSANPTTYMPKARSAAIKALDLDESLAEAHTSLAKINHSYDWDFQGAEREFKRAIQLNPNYPTARQWYGVFLSAMGRHDEAIFHRKRAQELDPTSLSINTGLGRAYYWARRYDEAIEQCREAHQLEPSYVDTHWSIGLCYEQKGMFEQAIAEFQDAVTLSNGRPTLLGALGHAYAKAGKLNDAQKKVDELNRASEQRYVSAYPIALIHVALGQKERAFEMLEKAYQERDEMITHLGVDPRLDELRGDPRFQDLLRRTGIK
jgi:eukaryotic-like serine/threonine-protein kinase